MNTPGVRLSTQAGTEDVAHGERNTPAVQDDGGSGAAEQHDSGSSAEQHDSYDFVLDIVDIYTLARTAAIRRGAQELTVISLAQQGYLATTPTYPTLAITFNTLEHFRLLRLRKPSFSMEAFAKVICDSYALPYRRRYRTALSDCFDVYLSILRVIEKRTAVILRRDTPDWRVKNSCPACNYELEDEPSLKYRRMFCFDGNNSLKRLAKIGDRAVADTREFTEGDYILPPAFVDRYKDEAKGASARGPQIDDHSDRDLDDDDIDAVNNDADDSTPNSTDPEALGDCTRNWKAAAPEENKSMWGIFDETGIFASACRHGFILWITDMIKSGELFKYPISIIAKAMDTLGPELLIGFDVGCTLAGTIDRSSLGAEFRRLGCRLCVDAFHGYSHSHQCQLRHHPSTIEGAGIEDLGTMERVFSASNQLAPVIRYASRYRRHVLIDQYFKQWDDDKYANLATMLLNNYRQALDIIEQDSKSVDDALGILRCRIEDLTQWRQDEVAYFANVGTEDPANVVAVEYVTLLREIHSIENQLNASTSAFIASVPEDWSSAPLAAPASNPTYHSDASQTRKRETERRHLREKWDRVSREVIALEVKMGIVTRWHPGTPEYVSAMQYIAQRDYRVALEKLHGLVVQRLFELHNMNISQTAYKVRTHIAKNLQRRSQAIRTAVNRYNAAAQALSPPRASLDWTKVTHYTFLEEFELLRDTRNDIRGKPWAQPLVRETMKKAHRVARAREELVRCNVEVHRLRTSIHDETATLDRALRETGSRSDPLAGPLRLYILRRTRVNTHLLAIISQIHDLPGFTGNTRPGRRKGSPASGTANTPSSSVHDIAVQNELNELSKEDTEDGVDDSAMADMSRLVNFAMNIV
ncbi:hypothetical protein C2E23DRAFT_741984 [Lenzites betulinus]|nr:hypothetical protein C2E23DRAFT_741984 [Lenzites betulinus]